jgi:ABC-type molybdate transport system substrate-binding protein
MLLALALAGAVSTPDSPAAGNPVQIANAGVLGTLVTGLKTLVPGVTITNTTGGSVALAQAIEAGTQSPAPDLFGSADANVNQALLGDANHNKERWFAAFAGNSIVMQYNTNAANPHHADFAALQAGTEQWWQPLVNIVNAGGTVNLCRSDPNADPSGYYTLFLFQLAEAADPANATALKKVLGSDTNPAQITSACSAGGKSITANGGIDVNFTYLSSAASSTTAFVPLPNAINLGDPDDVANYSTASFTNTAGQTFHGGVIRPSIAPIEGAAGAVGAEQVLLYMFQNQASLNTQFHFNPSALYAGGDPTSIPFELRPFFDLRRMHVLVMLDPGSCSLDRLQASGTGVTVTGATPVKPGQCDVTLDVATGATGLRDLIVSSKDRGRHSGYGRHTSNGGPNAGKTFADAINLLDAVPVVPSFLPDTTPKPPAGPPVTISDSPGNGITPFAPVTLTPAELAALPEQTVNVTIDGVSTTERGPSLSTLLTRAGVTFNSSCKNDELRYWIEATGARGAGAEITAGENDPGFGNNPAVLSLFENGAALPGPRLVVTNDRTSVRDITGVNSIVIGRAAPQLANTATPACTAAPFTAPVTAPAPGSVLINGDVAHPVTLTFAQLQTLPQVTQTDTFLQGMTSITDTEIGPTLFDVLAAAEPKFQFCGDNDNARFYIEVTSSEDGYTSIYSWAEIDPFLNGKQLLLSLSENGGSQASVGPRLTAPGDVKGGRYVSGSAVITVFRAPDAGPIAGCGPTPPGHPHP